MFTTSEIDVITTEYKKRQTERRKKLKKIWRTLLLITVIIVIMFVVLFPNQFDTGGTSWILPTYGGIALVITLLGYLISTKFNSVKPMYEYLYDEVIEKINRHEGMFLRYTAFETENVEFNKTGGLFTRHSSLRVKRHVEGDTENHHHFNIYDCTMTTSSGNSSTTHFDGIYFVLHKQVNTMLQVRSNGSPKLKGIKFHRIQEYPTLKVYKELEQQLLSIDKMYIDFITKLSESTEYKRVYLSIVDGEVHVALWYKKHPTRTLKNTSLQSMNTVATQFLDEYKLIGELADIDIY